MEKTLVKKNASIADTIALIVTHIDVDSKTPFVKWLSKQFGDPTDKVAYIKRLFDYVCRAVNYELDKVPEEDVFKPSRTITDAKGDCKKMTVLIGSVLVAAGIKPLIKHVFYKDADYTHVYIIVPFAGGNIIVDPVNNKKFNCEVKYSVSQIFDTKGNRMDLYTGAKPKSAFQPLFQDAISMGAEGVFDDIKTISCNATMSGTEVESLFQAMLSDETISGIGRKTKAQRKENRQKAVAKLKNVGLAIPRGAFLALLKINAFSLASHLAILMTKAPGVMDAFWSKLGGDVNILKTNVLSGANRKPQLRGTGQTFAVMAASAAPIIAAVVKLLKDHKLISENTADNAMNLVDEGGGSDEGRSLAPEPADGGDKKPLLVKRIDSNNVRPAPSSKKLDAVVEDGEDALADGSVDPKAHPDLADNSGKPDPTHGSFFSPFGIMIKGVFLSSVWQPHLQPGFLFELSKIFATYCVLGVILFPFYMMKKNYFAWYFEKPAEIFYSFFKLFKRKKIST